VGSLVSAANLAAMMSVDDEFDAGECRQAVQACCHEVVLVPNPTPGPPAGASTLLVSGQD
jgi:hypothetical protein